MGNRHSAHYEKTDSKCGSPENTSRKDKVTRKNYLRDGILFNKLPTTLRLLSDKGCQEISKDISELLSIKKKTKRIRLKEDEYRYLTERGC